MNKYQITIDRSSNNVGRLVSIANKNSLRAGIENDNGISISTENSEEKRKRAFFRHYRRHSQQLVDALKQWSSQLDFIDYEYSNGELHRHNQKLIEPYVPFMNYMKKHLHNDAYPHDFINPNSIQSNRKSICDKIEEIMVKDFSGMPHTPSFNIAINNKIKTICPRLTPTSNADTDSNNFYLPKRIHSILFDVISDIRTLQFSTKKISQDNDYDLMYENTLTLARGDELTISKLKTVLKSLIEEDDLRNHAKQYHELRAKLMTDIDLIELKRRVEELHTCIHGGKLLGGFQSCDLCIPDNIADVE